MPPQVVPQPVTPATPAPIADRASGTVLIVDDDPEMRSALGSLLRVEGFCPQGFASSQAVLDAPLPDRECCLIADVRLPGIGGLELYEQLKRRGDEIPVVFMTGHPDVALSVRAMKAGAMDFLPKPFGDQQMIDAVDAALAFDRDRRELAHRHRAVAERFAALTGRERQVMEGVVRGLMNKQIAWELEISEITVKLHRSSLMKKMQLRSVPDLVRASQVIEARSAA